MIDIQVRRAAYAEVKELRERYRKEANCQIIHDSFLARGLADAYLIVVDGRTAGYAGVGNKYPPDTVTEFYTLPHLRRFALPMFRAVLAFSHATHIEAQTNLPLALLMLYDCARNITGGPVLFEDAATPHLRSPEAVFRPATAEEKATATQQHEPVGDWVLAVRGTVVASGGFLTHYNPPYADIYMEVAESARRQGYGSFLVQELKRVCYEAGKKPAARCNPTNIASRRTLEKAGLLPCGRWLTGEVDPSISGANLHE